MSQPSMPLLRHVVPTVGPSAPPRLLEAQQVTLASIERALDLCRDHVEVEVVAARFPDEPAPVRPWLSDAPSLVTSSSDLQEFTVPRRLPLLREVLGALSETSDHDAVILSNVDIGIQPNFYEVVGEILDAGYDAFTINRRSVAAPGATRSPWIAAANVGSRHSGSDCFVMRPSLLHDIDVGDVLLGVRFVGRTLLEDLKGRARRFRQFGDLHVTFHLGDDRRWRDPALEDYEAFNHDQYLAARARRDSPIAVLTDHGRPGRRAGSPRGSTARTRGGRTPTIQGPRLIFCAATGRSGTKYLARLLDSVPGVSAAHERNPALIGPFLHDAAERGLAEIFEGRRAKALAIEVGASLAGPMTAYTDISHPFLTLHHDVVLEAFDHSRITIIDLRRDPVAIARSMASLGWFTDANAAWRDWLIDPLRPGNPLELRASDIEDPLDLILAHLADVMHRREVLRGATPTVAWVDADLPGITTRAGARQLIRRLGLPFPGITWPRGRLRGQLNERTQRKAQARQQLGTAASEDEVAARMQSFIARWSARPGIDELRREFERWRS